MVVVWGLRPQKFKYCLFFYDIVTEKKAGAKCIISLAMLHGGQKIYSSDMVVALSESRIHCVRHAHIVHM
jgi:hypothetical protein